MPSTMPPSTTMPAPHLPVVLDYLERPLVYELRSERLPKTLSARSPGLRVLPRLTRLRDLAVMSVTPKALEIVTRCGSVRNLSLVGVGRAVDLSLLARMGSHLEALFLARAPALTDLGFLGAFPRLERLHLLKCAALADLTPLCACRSLRDVTLPGAKRIASFLPLRELPALEALHAGDIVTADGKLEFFCAMPSIRSVHVARKWPLAEVQRVVDRRPQWYPWFGPRRGLRAPV